MTQRKTVGVVGASGYTGAELLRLLAEHPRLELVAVSAHTQAGRSLQEVHPHLSRALPPITMRAVDELRDEFVRCDAVFLALPHGESMEVVAQLVDAPLLIDLGGDFRLKDPLMYERWYQAEHTATDYLAQFVYGLPELFREEISSSRRIANPGCYPTAVSLGTAPLLRDKLIRPSVVASCVSGTSGAGKGLKEHLHFSHMDGNVYAYRLGCHQHTPEMEQALSRVAGVATTVNFIPHVVPMSRGIHATIIGEVVSGVRSIDIDQVFRAQYQRERFVQVVTAPPSTKLVQGTNMALIHAALDDRLQQVIVTVAIDNLVKGAAGQAIQNANLALGFPEELGLPVAGVYP